MSDITELNGKSKTNILVVLLVSSQFYLYGITNFILFIISLRRSNSTGILLPE